jgi:hypothetical protein
MEKVVVPAVYITRDPKVVEREEKEKRRRAIEHRFTYHSPKGDQAKRYGEIRDAAKALALLIDDKSPVSREQSLAFTALEEVVMWANASIARNE